MGGGLAASGGGGMLGPSPGGAYFTLPPLIEGVLHDPGDGGGGLEPLPAGLGSGTIPAVHTSGPTVVHTADADDPPLRRSQKVLILPSLDPNEAPANSHINTISRCDG